MFSYSLQEMKKLSEQEQHVERKASVELPPISQLEDIHDIIKEKGVSYIPPRMLAQYRLVLLGFIK